MIDAPRASHGLRMEADIPLAEDDGLERRRSTSASLRSVILVYEDRKAWIARARRGGLSRHGAELTSHWLLGFDTIRDIHASLSDAARGTQVSVQLYELDDFLPRLPAFLDEAARSSTLIWNITDGVLGFRGSHLVSLAELHGMSYFGCPPFAHQLAQDKFKLYSLCAAVGIRTPASALVENGHIIATSAALPDSGVYFVKPNSLGNKVGIGRKSLCKDLVQARRQAKELQAVLRDRAVVQSFVAGPEVRVTYIDAAGSDDMALYGFDVVDENLDGEHFVDFRDRERKYDGYINFRTWSGYDDARRQHALRAMTEAVRLLGRHVRVKDYFAVDFRLDAAGNPFLLDFNPGAFLYGDEVEGYTRAAFKRPLPAALLSAMELSHRKQRARGRSTPDVAFRV